MALQIHRAQRYLLYAVPGLVVGSIGVAIGAFLASGENDWRTAVHYSAVGFIFAPWATLAWATHRLRRRQIFAGVALLAGLVASMAILYEMTEQHAGVVNAFHQSPFVFAAWLFIWMSWIALAVMRLIAFAPGHTRRHSLARR